MSVKMDSTYSDIALAQSTFRKDEQVRLLYMQALVSNCVIITISILYYFLLRNRLNSNILVFWVVLLLVFSLYRLYLWYTQKKQAGKRSAEAWLNLYMVGCGLIGMSWSLIYPCLIISNDPIVLASLLILAFGVMSSAIPILSAYIPAFVLYTYPQGIALVTTLSCKEDPTYSWLALAVVIYLLMITLFTRNTNKSILRSIDLMQQNRSLIDDLNMEIDQREDLIAERTFELQKKNEDLISEMRVRKKTEEELRKSERKFKVIFENSPMAVVHFDEDGVVTACNDLLCNIMGATREKLINFNALNSIKDEEMLGAIKRALSGKIGQYQGDYLSITGNTVSSINGNFGPIFSTDETVIGVIGILEDISEKNRVRREKKQLESQLQQAHKMESIGTLAGGIAHEFNNIIAIIMGNNELITEELPKKSLARESSEEIRVAGLRARDIVKQLLTFSRQDDVVNKVIDLRSVVKESLKLIRSSTPVNIEIEQYISADTHLTMGNETQINQLLINLCNNAIAALPENGGVITVELSSETIDTAQTRYQVKVNAGHYSKLIVRDNGIGMNDVILSRVFEPYFTTKAIGEGTGIGMAVVHGIVKRHGGEIFVESKPDNGSTFTILLPAYEGEVQKKANKEDYLPTGNESVLYVDDEPSIARLGKRHLENLGYTAESTTDPVKALERFRDDPAKFDLLITDMAMPNMTGEQLIIEVKKIRKDFPTIICTGFSSKMSKKTATNIGVSAYVMKPINKMELAKIVRKVLDGGKKDTSV